MSAKKSEVLWAIWNPKVGTYWGTHQGFKREAIMAHTDSDSEWKDCLRSGDRAVRVRVTVLDKVK